MPIPMAANPRSNGNTPSHKTLKEGLNENKYVYVKTTLIGTIIFIIAFAILLDFTMLYPAQAQFANPLNITFKNAFLFAISNLPYVLIMLLLNALPILLFLGWTELFIVLIPFYLFMGFAGTCYVNCRFLKKIFKPYVPEESKTEEI